MYQKLASYKATSIYIPKELWTEFKQIYVHKESINRVIAKLLEEHISSFKTSDAKEN